MCLTSLSQHVIFQIELVGLCSRKFCGNREFKHQFYSNLRQSCKFSGTNQTWTNQWRPLGHVDQKWSSFSTHWRRHQPVLNNAALVIDESLWICRTCNLQKTEALAVYLSLNTCHRVVLAAQWTHFRMGLIRAHGLCFLQWLMSEADVRGYAPDPLVPIWQARGQTSQRLKPLPWFLLLPWLSPDQTNPAAQSPHLCGKFIKKDPPGRISLLFYPAVCMYVMLCNVM